ncbi:MAG: hypothetical protein QOE35_2677 [Actinomycetota bacterium]|jgi:hypothetical protein
MAVDEMTTRLDGLEGAIRSLTEETREANRVRLKYQRLLLGASALLLVVGTFLVLGLAWFFFGSWGALD